MYNSYCVPGQHRDLYSTPNKNVIIIIIIIIIIIMTISIAPYPKAVRRFTMKVKKLKILIS